MLSCNNISISYNENLILKNFAITIYPNSITVIRGANGTGKSSLLKILAGLSKSNEGQILWEGKNIDNNLNYYRKLITHIGHNNAIKPELTVFENLEFWANLNGHIELLLTAIGYFRLNDYVDTYCEKLSAGYKQRVALARLIINPNKIWLLDEAENNLDKEGIKLLLNLLTTRAEQGGIVIMATHNQLDLKNILEVNLDDYKINY